MSYRPPYEIDPDLRRLLGRVAILIGRLEGVNILANDLRLRRSNRIRSLHSSLAIEGNRLTVSQVTAILDGKTVRGPARDILEVQNAIRAYDLLAKVDPNSEESLLNVHATLMQGLIADAGRYRSGGVGVIDGDTVVHLAPPAGRVPELMGQLFEYLTQTPEDTIIKSCVFHYEFEFIHPFSDGNGRMGRLWQTAILARDFPLMADVPLESIVHRRQQAYYDALLASQRAGSSTPFIWYALEALQTALEEQLSVLPGSGSAADRLEQFAATVGSDWFSRSDYLAYHTMLSPATATRDLRRGLDRGRLEKTGQMRNTRYRFLI